MTDCLSNFSSMSEHSDAPSASTHKRSPSERSYPHSEVASDQCYHLDDDEYNVDPSPLSSPERGITRCRLASQITGEVKRLKIELPPSVIRRFLDNGRQSLEDLPDMNNLRAIADRAAVVVRVCGVPPVQAFYYCVDYPDGTPEGFLDLRRRAILAFHLEGMRIMHMLQEEDRQALVDTPLDDVLEEFRNRDARLLVLSALKHHVDEETAKAILEHPACQGRISIGGEESALATKLLTFWNERTSISRRRDRLKVAFAEYGMRLRDHCAFCNAYIDGKVDADLDDVIGISVIASRLKGRRLDIRSHLPACEGELRRCLHHRTTPLKQAVHQSMLAPLLRSARMGVSGEESLIHCMRPTEYLPFSVMVLKGEIIPTEN